MASNATLIMNAMPGFLAGLYDDIPTVLTKNKPDPDPSSPLAGWRPGIATTCFVVDVEDPEPVDNGIASFEEIFVRYEMTISYVKPAAAEPGRWDEDSDIRDKRQTIRDAIYKPTFAPVNGIFDVRYSSDKVYEVMDSTPMLIVSPMRVSFLTTEPRGFN